jgi:transcription elongation factor Elf1
MPARKKPIKKTVKKTTKRTTKKAAAKKTKKTFVCMPCGTEVVVSKEGMGITRLICCGEVMRPKRKGRC